MEWAVAPATRKDTRSTPSMALQVERKVERTATFADPRDGAPPGLLSVALVVTVRLPVRGGAGCASWQRNCSCWPQAPNSQQTEPPERVRTILLLGAPAAAAAEASG